MRLLFWRKPTAAQRLARVRELAETMRRTNAVSEYKFFWNAAKRAAKDGKVAVVYERFLYPHEQESLSLVAEMLKADGFTVTFEAEEKIDGNCDVHATKYTLTGSWERK